MALPSILLSKLVDYLKPKNKPKQELAEHRRIKHIDFDKASNTWVDENRYSYKRIRRKS